MVQYVQHGLAIYPCAVYVVADLDMFLIYGFAFAMEP